MERAQIARSLADYPGWLRSFHACKSLVTAMIDDDELARVKPHNGAKRNMVALTEIGARRYGITANPLFVQRSRTSLIAELKERVERGEGIIAAGKAMGMSMMLTRALWSRIKVEQGTQAR